MYQNEEMDGLGVDIYVRALKAEGLEIKKPGSSPLHMLPLFQTLNDGIYQGGWPRRSPYAEREIVYKNGDLPVSEAYYSKALSLPTFTSPEDKKIIEQYSSAFRKVYENRAELINYQNSLPTISDWGKE
ncbi:hypothetical protein [Thermoactinomyces mirandus]|uniref:Uncharacterized protein n=1 Tax=Thermoactinomyces mirandus TaxID=2756294 RepID=A0A7W1XQC8_9BACL|nr:hypothetical protein [Thermoactinomyces mirandus]MBA4601359.1 hypothetical protein [Thermoactinomyces mirandus]